MDIKRIGKIGVLMGGVSSERDISLKSGKAVYESLKGAGLDVEAIDIVSDDDNENKELLLSKKINCAFIALHGRFGEDGKVQSILEELDITYTGSDPQASELAMDKIASRNVFRSNGLDVPNSRILEAKGNTNDLCGGLTPPFVVKPACQGSSIGISMVEDESSLSRAVEEAFGFDTRVIIEEFISGREMTVGILGDKALAVIEVVPKNKFFDFEAKYKSGMTEYIVPAVIDQDLNRRLKEIGLKAHKLLGCRGCSRVDMIVRGSNIFVLEVNTIPGMTSTSLLPKAAKVEGLDFAQLCQELIRLAYEKE